MSKTFEAKPGDRWTRDNDGDLWLYRDKKSFLFNQREVHESGGTFRFPSERDLPTPDALAQLREWGYVVTVDEHVTRTITPSGMVIETRYVFPGDYKIDPPITEARVREIVESVLAASIPPPPDVAEPDWKGLLEDLVRQIDIAAPYWNVMWTSDALAAARKAVGK